MTFDWAEFLPLAKELSRMDSEAAKRSAISRAYYAAYNIAYRHKGTRKAYATRGGSHGSVWDALINSGNPAWRIAGHRGKRLVEFRRKADYDDTVSGLNATMRETIADADEILRLLS